MLTLIGSMLWTCQAGFQGEPARPWAPRPGVQLRTGAFQAAGLVGRSVGRSVDESKTGGQAATQGCELTVVLPSFHSMPRPPLGGVEGTGFEEALPLCWNPPGVRKGWFLFTCQATSTQRGAFASCSHCTVHEHLCLQQEVAHRARRGWGQERKRCCLPESPYSGCCPSEPETCCPEPAGFWREVWLVPSPMHEEWASQQPLGLTAATAHPSPGLGPGANLGRKRRWQSPRT